MAPKVALVLGANGISGHAMLEVLIKTSPSDWSSIIAVSRKPQQVTLTDGRLKFLAIDILAQDVQEIVRILNEAGGDQITHVFHYTYIEGKNAQDQVEVNVKLLRKTLDAIVAVAKHLQVFTLQTGLKHYGCHLAAAPMPFVEDLPRVFPNDPNFYYDQLDLLVEYAEKYGFKWIDTRPGVIIGVSKANVMNMASCIGIYAAVQKELGLPLTFPGNPFNWDMFQEHSTAYNNANFQLFVSTHEKAGNQAYNITNGDLFKYRLVWPKLAEYFGLALPHPLFTVSAPTEIPIGQKVEYDILQQGLAEYMKDKKPVWQKIAAKYRVDPNAIDQVNFAFADFLTGRPIPMLASLGKARKLGWTAYVDSADSYIENFEQLRDLHILPRY